MTEAYTLKPCPFCGAEAEILREGTTRQSMRIACTNCNTEVESGDVIGLTPPEKWRWNQRVPVTVSENTTPAGIPCIKCQTSPRLEKANEQI